MLVPSLWRIKLQQNLCFGIEIPISNPKVCPNWKNLNHLKLVVLSTGTDIALSHGGAVVRGVPPLHPDYRLICFFWPAIRVWALTLRYLPVERRRR